MMEEQDDLRKQDPACCCLPTPMTLDSGGVHVHCGSPASFSDHLVSSAVTPADNLFLISASKLTVTLFTTDKHHFQMYPDITLEDTHLPLERIPKILGVIMDPSLSFHKHCNYVSDRIDKRNNMLKALAGSS